MITTAQVSLDIIQSDQVHFEALRRRTLNLRAYAKLIQPRVEAEAKKSVSIASIVVALSRIRKSLKEIAPLRPQVSIENLSIKADLSVITYEKTAENLVFLSKITSFQHRDKDFLVVAEGIAEITIVGDVQKINEIEKTLKTNRKARFDDAVAVTIHFDQKYVEIPNVLFNFVSNLAIKRVNLLQIVSNLTEVSFIVEQKYVDDTIDVFKRYLRADHS